jgi:rod shape-determining protein MreB
VLAARRRWSSATRLRIAGDELDEAIINHLRRHHNLAIGEQTAERIKLTIGSAWPMQQELSMEVKGRDTISGLPRRKTVTSIEIREALSRAGAADLRGDPRVLEEAPPELSADLVDTGVTLVGGGALLATASPKPISETTSASRRASATTR